MIPHSTAFANKLNSTNRTVHKKILIYDTMFAVPTNGISFKMYEHTGSANPDWPSTNVINNPDFYYTVAGNPMPALGWLDGGFSPSPDYTLSNNVLKITAVSGMASQGMNVAQSYTFDLSKTYRVYIKARSNFTTTINIRTGSDVSYSQGNITITSDGVSWTEDSIEFSPASQDSMLFICGGDVPNSGQWIDIDYVRMEIVEDSSNLVQILPASTAHNGAIPNLVLTWGYGAPFYMAINKWAVEFTGYFYAEQSTSALRFWFYGDDIRVQMLWGNGYTQVFAPTTIYDGEFYNTTGTIPASKGFWYPFKIRINGGVGTRKGGFACLYSIGVGDPAPYAFRDYELIPLNAGVVNSTGAFLSPISVTNVASIDGDAKENEPSTYSFIVPLSLYAKDSDGYYVNGSIVLREGRLIKIYAGFDCDTSPSPFQTVGIVYTNIEYVPRFTGIITGFSPDIQTGLLTVSCRDFMAFTENMFCINYPDAISYWSSRYFIDSSRKQPDGVNKPIAYDRWGFIDAIKDLFIKSGLPYSLLRGKEYRQNSSNVVVGTSDCIPDNGYVLSAADKYGDISVEEYVHKFDTGTSLFDAISELVDTYGYYIGFRYDGMLQLRQTNNATNRINSSDVSVSNPVDGNVTDIDALRGSFFEIPAFNDYARYEFSGTGCAIVVIRGTDCGVNDNSNSYWLGTPSCQINLRNSLGAVVDTWEYNLYLDEAWYYSYGVYDVIGANPCIIQLTQGLPYDNYTLEIKNITGSYDIRIDEVWGYNYNYTEISKTFRTHKSSGEIASLNSMEVSRSLDDVRNDVLVVGQRKGMWVATGDREVGLDDPEFSDLKNQQLVNYHARSVDVESIYNPDASNYIGRNITTYIQEPNINSRDRARWLSFNILRNYRNVKNKISASIIGDPILEKGDCISVSDTTEMDGTDNLYVKGYNESIKDKEWMVSVDVAGTDPYPSYEEDFDYDISLYNNRYLANLAITDSEDYNIDGTFSTTLNGAHDINDTTLTVNDSTSTWDATGRVLVYNSTQVEYGVFFYTSKTTYTITGEWVYYIPMVSGTTSFASGSAVINAYNPYSEQDYGNFVKISFKCLVKGIVSVGIRSAWTSRWVSGLSDGGSLDEGLPKKQTVNTGDNVEFIWGGVDELGYTHVPNSLNIGKNYFAQDSGALGKYYCVIEYVREEDNELQTTDSSEYYDEFNVLQSKQIALKKSDVPKMLLTYTAATTNRSPNVQYSPGNNGGYIYNSWGPSSNKEFVWTSSDGELSIKYQSYNVDVDRKYFITAKAMLNVHKVFLQDPGLSTTDSDTLYIGPDYDPGNGSAVMFNNSEPYTVIFNPIESKWGGFSPDDTFNQYFQAYRYNTAAYYGVIYWILYQTWAIDASGRKALLVDTNGNVVRPVLTDGDGYQTAQSQIWRFTGGQEGCLEFCVIPKRIHDTATYGMGSFFRVVSPNYKWQHKPSWEAKDARPPACWVKDWWSQ